MQRKIVAVYFSHLSSYNIALALTDKLQIEYIVSCGYIQNKLFPICTHFLSEVKSRTLRSTFSAD